MDAIAIKTGWMRRLDEADGSGLSAGREDGGMGRENDVQVGCSYVIAEDVVFAGDFDGVGDEAEDGTDPQQHGESSEEILAEFDPLGRRLGRRQGVGTVALEDRLGLRHRQTLSDK